MALCYHVEFFGFGKTGGVLCGFECVVVEP